MSPLWPVTIWLSTCSAPPGGVAGVVAASVSHRRLAQAQRLLGLGESTPPSPGARGGGGRGRAGGGGRGARAPQRTSVQPVSDITAAAGHPAPEDPGCAMPAGASGAGGGGEARLSVLKSLHDKRKVFVGRFDSEEEAGRAYDRVAIGLCKKTGQNFPAADYEAEAEQLRGTTLKALLAQEVRSLFRSGSTRPASGGRGERARRRA